MQSSFRSPNPPQMPRYPGREFLHGGAARGGAEVRSAAAPSQLQQQVALNQVAPKKARIVIQCTSLSKNGIAEFVNLLSDLNAAFVATDRGPIQFIRSSPSGLSQVTTHLLAPTTGLRRTEKLLSAIAHGGVWILPTKWLMDSVKKKMILDERKYDLGRSGFCDGGLFIAQYEARVLRKKEGGVFKAFTVVILTDVALRHKLSAVLQFGGATVHSWPLQHLMDASSESLEELTHLLVDPILMVEEKYRELLGLKIITSERVPIISYTYVEEYLTSSEPPLVKYFDALNRDVLRMHQETNQEEQMLPPHNTMSHGSPCLSIQPKKIKKLLRQSFKLETTVDFSFPTPDESSYSFDQSVDGQESSTPPSQEQDAIRGDESATQPRGPVRTNVEENVGSLSSWLERQMEVKVPVNQIANHGPSKQNGSTFANIAISGSSAAKSAGLMPGIVPINVTPPLTVTPEHLAFQSVTNMIQNNGAQKIPVVKAENKLIENQQGRGKGVAKLDSFTISSCIASSRNKICQPSAQFGFSTLTTRPPTASASAEDIVQEWLKSTRNHHAAVDTNMSRRRRPSDLALRVSSNGSRENKERKVTGSKSDEVPKNNSYKAVSPIEKSAKGRRSRSNAAEVITLASSDSDDSEVLVLN